MARDIAVITRLGTDADRPALVWLGGYRSDMSGTKAIEMDALAAEQGITAIRFDYSGHGVSGGDFAKGTISRWTEEALAVIAATGVSKVVLIGSSMGGLANSSFRGAIDDIRLYRTLVPAAEIAARFATTLPPVAKADIAQLGPSPNAGNDSASGTKRSTLITSFCGPAFSNAWMPMLASTT